MISLLRWKNFALNDRMLIMMTVSYNRLWKLLIDKNMNKTQLIKKVLASGEKGQFQAG